MASYYLCPISAIFQYLTDTGVPASGLLIWTYLAGTSTPTNTWTDITGVTPNSNPIQTLSNGRLQNQIWQQGGVALKIQVSTNSGTVGSPIFGNQVGPTFDQISGIDDPTMVLSGLSNPASGSGADLVANAMRSYDLIASVRAANVPTIAAGQTLIIGIEGGTTVTDGKGGLFYWNASSTATDDGLNVIKPTAELGAGRYLRLVQSISSSFTGTFTGFTTTVTATVQYRVYNNVAYLFFNTTNPTGTSNSTALTMTGLPSIIFPSQNRVILCCVEDNSNTEQFAFFQVDNAGNCTFFKYNVSTGNFSSSGFTSSNTKGLPVDWVVSYPIS